jgi:hypothetical protein
LTFTECNDKCIESDQLIENGFSNGLSSFKMEEKMLQMMKGSDHSTTSRTDPNVVQVTE